MKRIISLCCIALILVTSLAVSVNADGFSNFLEALDYGFPNNGTTGLVGVYSSTQDVRFTIPYNIVYYVDIVAVITGQFPTSISFLPGGQLSSATDLNFEHIGNNLFRIYGNCNPNLFADFFTLRFDTTESYVNFMSVRFLVSPFGNYKVGVEGVGSYPGGSFNISKDWGDQRPTTTTIVNDGTDFNNRDFYLYLQPKEWKKYDFIEYQLSLMVSDITSISCVMGNINIPIDVSYTQFSNSDSSYYLTLSFDVSNLDRTSDDYPMVIIEGHVVFDGVSSVSLTNSKGYINLNSGSDLTLFLSNLKYFFSSQFNSLYSWIQEQSNLLSTEFYDLIISISMEFTNLKSSDSSLFSDLKNSMVAGFGDLKNSMVASFGDLINKTSSQFSWTRSETSTHFNNLNLWIIDQTYAIVSAIRGDTSPGDSFQNKVDQKDQQMDEMAAVMDSVQKPDIDQINVSVDQYVSQADIHVLASPMAVFFEGELFSQVIIMSILLATVSYVLYGKR